MCAPSSAGSYQNDLGFYILSQRKTIPPRPSPGREFKFEMFVSVRDSQPFPSLDFGDDHFDELMVRRISRPNLPGWLTRDPLFERDLADRDILDGVD